MSGFELAMAALVPAVIGAAIVAARWLAGQVMDRIERRGAKDEIEATAPRAVMTTKRRAIVVDVQDFEGRN